MRVCFTLFLSTVLLIQFCLCVSFEEDVEKERKPDLVPHIVGQPGIGCSQYEEWKPCGACDRACGQSPVICPKKCRKGECGCIKDYRRAFPGGPCRHFLQCSDILNPGQPLKCSRYVPCPYGRYCTNAGFCQKYWIWTEPLDEPDFGDD
uniref:TIL domain-containing protein n=1 Tax=Plectus sambesii TaxID=2011161 RepID=A0A914UHT6_9BILA